ncbi:AI-2E family transporter [Pelotalea chapellei]|uniref:AI-2E family transporter n=1 Tax=Pelotalea chapellei TaxID=44671 RepID=A0ABS5UB77_9BACT|nr:AI-2E family transporter [Pelotalea chapellei]MBT1072893.1 AI-2E family transporter [Pelotalea chapellei]
MDKKIYLTIIAALATLAFAWLVILLATPVLKPLAWALIIGIATIPLYDRLAKRFPDRPGTSAGVMVLIVIVCFILPVVGLIVSIANNAPQWFADASNLVQEVTRSGMGAISKIPYLNRLLELAERNGINVAKHTEAIVANASAVLLNAAATTAKGLASILFTLAVALFILFFIYRDGQRVLATAVRRFASNEQRVRRFLSRVQSTVSAVFLGTIYTCIAQGTTAGIGYYVADVPAPILWGALTAIAAVVPVVGTGVIWVPLTVFLVLKGAYLTAGLLALWCLLFVGLADNAIRPLAVGAQADVSALAILLGAIGGATTMGILGLIMGPVVFASLVTIWHELTDEENAGIIVAE